MWIGLSLGMWFGQLSGAILALVVGWRAAERTPSWGGVASSVLAACVAGEALIFVIGFGGLALSKSFLSPEQRHIWTVSVIGTGTWLVPVGAIIGSIWGRRRAVAAHEALAQLERKRFPMSASPQRQPAEGQGRALDEEA